METSAKISRMKIGNDEIIVIDNALSIAMCDLLLSDISSVQTKKILSVKIDLDNSRKLNSIGALEYMNQTY